MAEIASVTHVRTFERDLRAGVRLTITVSKSGYIGKVTTIVIRPRSPGHVRRPGRPRAIRLPEDLACRA